MDFTLIEDAANRTDREASLHALHRLKAAGWISAFEHDGPELAKLALTEHGRKRTHDLRSHLRKFGVSSITDPMEILYVCRVALAMLPSGLN